MGRLGAGTPVRGPLRPLASRPLTPPHGPRLLEALSGEEDRERFSPRDPGDSVERVARVAGELGLEVGTVHGLLDVGGAELEHLWAVVHGWVVDMCLPVHSDRFVRHLIGFVAGDLGPNDLERLAYGLPIGCRVVGEIPPGCRYLAPAGRHTARGVPLGGAVALRAR